MAPPSPRTDGTPLRSRLPFLPLDKQLEVEVLRGIHDLRSAGRFICLDDDKTKKRDDAYLIKRDKDAYRIFIAISPISIHTKFSWNHLRGYIPFEISPRDEMFTVHGTPERYSLGQGEGEGIVFDVKTDLNDIQSVALYRANLNSVPYAHPSKTTHNYEVRRQDSERDLRVPDYIEKEFLHVTGAESTRIGVEKLMRLQNALAARALVERDVSGIFDSYDAHGRLHFTHDPEADVVAAKASSPIRLSISRINSAQVASLLRTRDDAFPSDLCEQLCSAAAKGYRGHRAA